MSWSDRLQGLTYTTPSGVELTAEFEDVQSTIEAKGASYEFSDADGTYIHKRGSTGRRFPVKLFLTGPDCDLTAEAWLAGLREPGFGRLEHTLYGSIDVVPLGSIRRSDNLKSAANQVILEFVFWETNRLIYPIVEVDARQAVTSAILEFNQAASDQFEEETTLGSALSQAEFKGGFESELNRVRSSLNGIAESQDDVSSVFSDIYDSINTSIDVLIGQPITLASQTLLLVQTPSRSSASITDRLNAYLNLIGSITDRAFTSGYGDKNSNDFHSLDLYSSAYVSGLVLSSLNNSFNTKSEALSSAQTILETLDGVSEWREQQYSSLGKIDSGGAYQQLQEAVALTAGFLVQLSFSLQQERVVVLDRDRNILELVAELYGDIGDERLNFFIESNALSGSEYFEIKKGREIVYYI